MRFFAAISITSPELVLDTVGVTFGVIHEATGSPPISEYVFIEHNLRVGDRIIIRGYPSNAQYYPHVVTEVLEAHLPDMYPNTFMFYRNVTGSVAINSGHYPEWAAGSVYLWAGTLSKTSGNYDIANVDVSKSLKFGTQLHGGFSSASFQMVGQKDRMHEMLNKILNANVVITDGFGRTLWEGYITGTAINNPGTLEITCSGYYAKANDLYFDTTPYDALEATTNLMTYPSFDGGKGAWAEAFAIPYMPVLWSLQVGTGSPGDGGSHFLRIGQPAASYSGHAMMYDYTLWYPINSPSDIPANTTFVWSFYARSAGLSRTPYLQVYHGSNLIGGQILNTQLGAIDGGWRRFEFQITSGASTNGLLWLVINIPNSNSVSTGYAEFDCMQLERLSYATTYCDGSRPACSWKSGVVNGQSSRVLVPVKAATILKDTVAVIPSWQHNTTFVLGNEYNVGDVDFTDKKVREAIEWVCSFGRNDTDTNQEALATYFALWKDRIPYLVNEPAQDHPLSGNYPLWNISVDNLPANKMGLTMDLSNVFNRVFAVYSTAGEGPSYTNPSEDCLSQERYGIHEGKLQNSEYPCKAKDKCDVRDLTLQKYKFPKVVMSLEISGMAEYFTGAADYPFRIRAGHLVLIKDLDVLSSSIGLVTGQASYKVGFILKTDYDAGTNVCRVDIGASDVSYEVLMSRLGMGGGLQ